MLFFKNNCFVLFIGFLGVFLSACDNPFASTPGTQGKNIVTGIYITSEASELLGVWGDPSSYHNGAKRSKDPEISDEEEHVPLYFSFEVPYPNPFLPTAMVQFQIPESAKVSIWYESAYLPDSESPLPNQNRTARPFKKVYVLEEVLKNAGAHVVTLSTRSGENGEEVLAPTGFYRVFMKAGDFVAYHDIYVRGDRSEAPIGLRDYFPY